MKQKSLSGICSSHRVLKSIQRIYFYRNTIRTWFDKKQKSFNMSPLYTAIDEGDTDKMEEEISAFLEESIS